MNETDPAAEAEALLLRLAALLASQSRTVLRKRLTARGMRLSVRADPEPGPVAPDLPPVLAGERGATRRVFLAVREAQAPVKALGVYQRLNGKRPHEPGAEEVGRSTIDHAVRRLKELGLIHATKTGYRLGPAPADPQPNLPFCEEQSCDLSPARPEV